jgi:5-methylcytosine-specific restriction endonuclease McrA
LLLGPHLTEDNHLEVLARAKHRTKKEIKRLVRMLDPLPDVPALVEPLGPAPCGIAGNPTWSQMVEAHSTEIRELPPGDRPKDWIADALAGADLGANLEPDSDAHAEAAAVADPEPAPSQTLAPQRYRVQFTASQEYVELLETAKDLLAHTVPSRSIEEVHLRAMRALVSELKKRKTGATKQSSRPNAQVSSSEQSFAESGTAGDGSPAVASPRQRGGNAAADPRHRSANPSAGPRQRGRYVSRAVRRAVWKRDGERCTYTDATGQRCRETGGLELDHIDPHARGGPPTVANLRLRCAAHNALAAEHEFGRDFMVARIDVKRRTAQHR